MSRRRRRPSSWCGELYLSYGTAALKGARPTLTDVVAAFTALSPPMGLDYFAVFYARRLGAAVAMQLPARLAGAIAEKVDDELATENPRFLAAAHDGVGWWRTVIREAFWGSGPSSRRCPPVRAPAPARTRSSATWPSSRWC
ncbi:hypothetical protein HU200_049520 [Digitaria exilis]|uniref:Uncharacterized protein n=1 Tax=Digitaria exilis TaxID=1010633 RepID=A0A835E9Q2_9POAL|nr:hypothetical protein HU200_049520 [Digitaria exilis]